MTLRHRQAKTAALVAKADANTVRDAITGAFAPYMGRSQSLGGSALELAEATRRDRAASAALVVGNKPIKKARGDKAAARAERIQKTLESDPRHPARKAAVRKRAATLEIDTLSIDERDDLAASLDTEQRLQDRKALRVRDEQREKNRAKAQLEADAAVTLAAEEMEARYTNLIAVIQLVNLAAEDVTEYRVKEYEPVRRDAQALGLTVERVPKLGIRAALLERSILADLYRLRGWCGADI